MPPARAASATASVNGPGTVGAFPYSRICSAPMLAGGCTNEKYG